MYNVKQLREYIENVLWMFSSIVSKELDSPDAVELLLFTAAHESKMGTYLKQLNGGPAKGLFQIEPATWEDAFENYLKYRPTLYDAVQTFDVPKLPDVVNMMGNLPLQIVMARVIYMRVSEPLPDRYNIPGMAAYYKKYWNTQVGSATVDAAIKSYNKYVQRRENG